MLVPSARHPNGLSILQDLITDDCHVRAAVAFVTRTGVRLLHDVVAARSSVTISLTARAADVTEPEALIDLRDNLAADVFVVIGRRARAFHPKLWIIDRPDAVFVLSGSGNLTNGGLVNNEEQFEVLQFSPDDPAVEEHAGRIDRLVRHRLPLEHVEGSAIWREWLDVRRKQLVFQRQLADAEKHLLDREPKLDRTADKNVLIEDLQAVYDNTVAAKLPRADGGPYAPSRLLQSIKKTRTGERDPVDLVADIIRRRTQGLDILLEAGLFDLTLEALVLDASKPYHDLFTKPSVAIATRRLEEFRGAAPPPNQ